MTSVTVVEQVHKVEVVDAGAVVVVLEPVTTVVEVGVAGLQGSTGATGAQGPQGPQGQPGAATGSYRHVQAVPASEWTIDHALGMYPNVTTRDTLGRTVIGDLAYPTTNRVVVTFSAAISGEAYAS